MRKNHGLVLLLSVMLAACTATPPVKQAPPQPVILTPTPAPQVVQRTVDARQAQALVMSWQAMGLQAAASYDATPGRIEWRSIRSTVPVDARQADKIVAEAAAFAARASLPARIEIAARSDREDERLSRAVKAGALASGGRNRVKLDHLIAPDLAPAIKIEVWEAR